jgi:uncharacterized membrane protein HdeD (DUF308 family)
MTIGNVQSLDIQISHELARYWIWFFAFGLGLIVLGVAAVVRSIAATIVSMLFFGWLLLFACGIEIAQALLVGHWVGFFHHLLAAILFGVTGILLVARPLLAAEATTMLIAVFFLVGGLFQILGSAWVALPGWGWQVADGLITLLLGILVLAQWPASGLWVIGLFIGIDLIFYGAAWIALAMGLRAGA